MVRRSPLQTWTPPLCSTACLAIHLGSAPPDSPVVNSFKWHCWSIVKHMAMILTLLLDLILLPGEAVPRLLLHLETEPTVPPEVEVGCLCWTLGLKKLLSICSIYLWPKCLLQIRVTLSNFYLSCPVSHGLTLLCTHFWNNSGLQRIGRVRLLKALFIRLEHLASFWNS